MLHVRPTVKATSVLSYPRPLERREAAWSNPTTSFESALGLSPLFVREIRPMMTLLNLGDQLQHISPRILASR
jgi:hypothetical protein